jgi:hypothetical protein
MSPMPTTTDDVPNIRRKIDVTTGDNVDVGYYFDSTLSSFEAVRYVVKITFQ